MKRAFIVMSSVAIALTGLLLAVGSAEELIQEDADMIAKRFLGNYELVIYETIRPDGEVVDMDYVGRILYDEHGNMSAIGMVRSFPERAAGDNPPPRGGFAYFAKYSIDEVNGRVIHHVHGSPTAGGWVGTDLVRYYDFPDDDLLVLEVRNAEGSATGRLTWRRFP
jgi:hypothetical protein